MTKDNVTFDGSMDQLRQSSLPTGLEDSKTVTGIWTMTDAEIDLRTITDRWSARGALNNWEILWLLDEAVRTEKFRHAYEMEEKRCQELEAEVERLRVELEKRDSFIGALSIEEIAAVHERNKIDG